MLACPAHLQASYATAIAEEVTSALRHQLRNKLAAIRNSSFYLQRKVEKASTLYADDPRVKQFFELIETELDGCVEALKPKVPPTSVQGPRIAPGQAARSLIASLVLPGGFELAAPEPLPAVVLCAQGELELGLFVLIDNAVEAGLGAGVRAAAVRVRTAGAEAMIEVVSPGTQLPDKPERVIQPFFTTREGRLGVGLKIAKRIAARWGGRLDLTGGDEGVCQRLVLPLAGAAA